MLTTQGRPLPYYMVTSHLNHIIGSACRRGKRATIVPLGRISDTGNRSAHTLSSGRSRILDDTVSYLASDDLGMSLELVKGGKKAGGTE